MNFKEYYLKEKVDFYKVKPGILYHVTPTKNIEKIKKEGITPQKKASTHGAFGQDIRQQKDAIYAFDAYGGAWSWAFKINFESNQKMSIITFKKTGTWKEDTHWEAQTSSVGKWLYKKGTVTPNDINKIEKFNDKLGMEFSKQRMERMT